MKIQKKLVFAMLCFILIVFSKTFYAKAAAVDGAVEIFKECCPYRFSMDSIQDDHIILNWVFSNNYVTSDDDFTNPFIDIEGFEIQICTDKKYPSDKVKTYVTKEFVEKVESAEYTYQIPVSVLGKNGGKLYARIRAYGKIKTIEENLSSEEPTDFKVGDVVYGGYQNLSCWNGSVIFANSDRKEDMERDYCEYVKINKANWGSMYALIKKGYYYCDPDGLKSYYDKNQDGWLDPSEIFDIHTICNYAFEKSPDDQKYWKLFQTNKYQCKLSDLDGLKYLPWVTGLDIRDYTAKKLDLSKYHRIKTVSIREFWKSSFQLIAPYAKEIDIESETGGSWNKAKLESVDVSKCNAAVILSVGGSHFKYVTTKLPTSAKNLRWITLSYHKDKSIDLNKYKKLNMAYFYANKYTKCQMDKCTKLNYVYFYCMNDITSVNLKNAKNLKGVDVYSCKKLTPSGVKTVKNAKVTKNKGRFWESTKTWEKLVDDIYKSK